MMALMLRAPKHRNLWDDFKTRRQNNSPQVRCFNQSSGSNQKYNLSITSSEARLENSEVTEIYLKVHASRRKFIPSLLVSLPQRGSEKGVHALCNESGMGEAGTSEGHRRTSRPGAPDISHFILVAGIEL